MSVAKPLPHDAAALHVTGAARYVDDIPTPANTAHLAFGMAEIAKGRVTAMNLTPVQNAPGVIAVTTADDLPFANDVSPSVHDEPLLSDGTVHYLGQPLFFVVADTHLNARKAVRLAEITYAEETPIQTIEEALTANSRFEDGPRVWTKGNVDQALASAPHSVHGRIDMGGQEHFYLEGQAALAIPQEGGDMLVHSSTQHPTEIQHKVADALGLPMHAVRCEVRRMGGGFGGKESQGNALAVACAVAARATGRPCKMRYDRDDDMMITGKRHDFRIDYTAGFDDDGRLLAVDFVQATRCGWALDLSLPVADRAMLHADNAYHLPAARITSHRLKTNTQSATAFRGFGGPQGVLGIERVMDHIAATLGADPADIRRINYYAPMQGTTAAKPRKMGLDPSPPQTTPYHMPVSDFILHELTERLLTKADYNSRREKISAWNATHDVLKKGIAFSPVKFGISFTLSHLNQAGALVHVYQDGSVHMNHGGTEMGQGLFQKVAQVAAHRFGIDVSAIKITATDTGKVPNTSATAASSGTDLNGMAVANACDIIRDRIAACLAELHQTTPDTVQFKDDHVHVGTETMTFAQAAQTAYLNRVSLSATGFYKTPGLSWDRIKGEGTPFFYFAQGAAITEVVIDTLTGENRILRTDILHDAGASLNPALDIGQVEGAYVQGAGWLTTEELRWNDSGMLISNGPANYKIPTAHDTPPELNVAFYQGANSVPTVHRSKAVGEPPLMLAISVWCALRDACSAAGDYAVLPPLAAPATPEAVFWAVRKARGDN